MRKSARITLVVLLIIAVLLVALRIALPGLVRDFLNEKMADMGSYSGHVDDVDIMLWRGAYQLNGLSIEKTTDAAEVPLLEVPEVDIAVSWSSLFGQGALVAQLTLHDPEMNFVDGEGEKNQTGEGVDWRDKLREMLPIRLETVKVINGEVHFRNFTSEPPVDVYATKIDLTAHGLSNAKVNEEGKPEGRLNGKAMFLAHAPLDVHAEFDPLVSMDDFHLKLRITGIELTRLNDFARAYGNFDFKSGTGDLVVELDIVDSQLDGYIKPLLHNAEVFDWQQDVEQQDKGFWRNVWEGVVGAAESVLQNQPKDQVATRVELNGSLKDPEVSPFQMFVAILRNAFIEAFQPRFENPEQ
ncbi:DUF748 domain-containing protein [Stutzerimonas urumqiensis]|uniref:DUF748 domain-containing protein n=1 Tax=Stutzerimonas urumqiensis TaxID=638269 RepID=UPI003BA9E01E